MSNIGAHSEQNQGKSFFHTSTHTDSTELCLNQAVCQDMKHTAQRSTLDSLFWA